MASKSQDSKGLNEVNASEILFKIKNSEPVEYDYVIIKGHLDTSGLGLTKDDKIFIIASSIRITHSKIENAVIFSAAIFQKGVDFGESQFMEYSSFGGSIFKANAIFGGSQFDGEVYFTGAQFDGDATFSRSQFSRNASFGRSQFNKGCFFRKSQFNEDSNFNRSTFKGETNFRGARFCGKTSYRKAKFCLEADFSKSEFAGDLADFESAQFMGDAFFDDVVFKEMISFSRTKYEKLYIRWKSITKARYKWHFLENYRRLSNLAYESDHGEATYLSLIENFKKLGFLEDADNCYYDYRKERRRDLPRPYKPVDWVLMVFYGYGIKPIRPLMWAVVFFFAFSLLYTTLGEFIGFTDVHSFVSSLNVSYTLLLAGTKLTDDPNHASTGLIYMIFTFEKLLGSLFFALFLVSVGRTIIR